MVRLREARKLLFNEDRVQVWQDEKALEMDGGDSYRIQVSEINNTQLYIFKWLRR